MNKKQLAYTAVLSSCLTLFLLGAFFYLSDLVIAQDDAVEPSDGFVVPNSETEDSSVEFFSDLQNLSSDGQLDPAAQTVPAQVEMPLADADNMSHWFILGSHLLPRRSDLTYTYNIYGCMSITGGTGNRMQFPVSLPDGSIIKSMDIIYDDTSTSNLRVWLSAYNPGVSNTDLTSVSSTGSAGSGTASSAEISHLVDNSQNAYSIIYSWAGVTDSSLQICGIRVNYIDPFYASFLPIITSP